MWPRVEKGSGPAQGESRQKLPVVSAHPAPPGSPLCCGEAMEPRLVHARDRYGQTIFVAVRCCPRCGRISY
jgi:hypothetical protein